MSPHAPPQQQPLTAYQMAMEINPESPEWLANSHGLELEFDDPEDPDWWFVSTDNIGGTRCSIEITGISLLSGSKEVFAVPAQYHGEPPFYAPRPIGDNGIWDYYARVLPTKAALEALPH